MTLVCLLERAWADDGEAWKRLWDWANCLASKVISSYVRRDASTRDEALSEFSLRFFKAVQGRQIPAQSDEVITKYVYRIAKNCAIDALRARNRRRHTPLEDLGGHSVTDPGPWPDQVYDDQVRRARMRRIVLAYTESVPATWAYILRRKLDRARSTVIAREIQEIFGERITPATVDSRYSRMTADLRRPPADG